MSIWPVDPRVSPTVFPIRVSPLLNVKRSPKSPVPLLYEIPPVAESEVSPILALNVFQSVRESAPVVVEDASPRESPVPTRESPLAGERIEISPCLLLNVVQSVPVSAPVVVALAFPIENTHVRLLYARGPIAERAVSPIFVATTPESVARLAVVSARFPERVFTVVVRVERLPESVAMFPVAVAIFELIVTS